MFRVIALLCLIIALAGCRSTSNSSNGSEKNVNQSAKVHTELAGLYYERAQLGIALAEIEQALQADKNHAPAYGVRALIHMELREDTEAEEDFRRSLSLDKNDSNMHNNYGWFLCQRGREAESIPQFMAAVKNPLYTTPGMAYLNAGLCSKKGGNTKDAEAFLQKALLVQPGMPQALYASADLNFAIGDYFMAKKYLKELSEKSDDLSAEQLWLAIQIQRKTGDRNSEESYSAQLRKRYPDSRENQSLMRGE
ncbi:MAG: type IV pilus biogenesis/stability protein PilW [Gallionella sp.]